MRWHKSTCHLILASGVAQRYRYRYYIMKQFVDNAKSVPGLNLNRTLHVIPKDPNCPWSITQPQSKTLLIFPITMPPIWQGDIEYGMNVTVNASPIEGFSPQSFPAAVNEYDAQTISTIVFGIFMALLALFTAFRYCCLCKGMFVDFISVFELFKRCD